MLDMICWMMFMVFICFNDEIAIDKDKVCHVYHKEDDWHSKVEHVSFTYALAIKDTMVVNAVDADVA